MDRSKTAIRANRLRRSTVAHRLRALSSIAAAGLIGVAAGGQAHASENGLTHYPDGINTVLNGVLPAPGTLQGYSYSLDYDATSFDGANGNKQIPGFKANIAVEGPRFVYTWPVGLGPFHFSSGIVPAFANITLSAEGHSGRAFGLVDLAVEPLYVSYSNPSHTFFAFFGPDIYTPNGSYKADRMVNLGNNYVTIAPGLHTTWMPNHKWELDASFVPQINFTNAATHYRSGDSLTVDYAVHYRPFESIPKLRFAVQGYVFRAVQDDTVNGVKYLNGFRGQAFAIGPQIEYDIVPRGGILFKYQQEVDVQNRSKGSRFWVEYSQPIFSPKS
jgi:hypothetical protein